MNIWILNHYAGSPDMQATRSYDFGRRLVQRGHQVTIFASSFSHYTFREERLAPGEDWREEDCGGVRFIWVKTTPYTANTWHRALNMLSYSWRAWKKGRALKEIPDLIMGTCVHPLAPLIAYRLARKKGSRFFYEVTDLWPQTLVDMGELSDGGPVTWALRKLERFLFERAEKIISLLPNLGEYLDEIGMPGKEVVWIPNGIDLSIFDQLKPYDGGNGDSFTFMYLGGHSQYHGLEHVLDAAGILQDRGEKRIRVVLVGGGTQKPRLLAQAEEMQLDNVEFRDIVPKSELFRVIGEADGLLYSFRKLQLLRFGVSPVKIFDYLGSGRPIIYSVEGKNNPIDEAKAGITIPPEDPRAWAQAMIDLTAMSSQERKKMGENGLGFVKDNHTIDILADRLEAAMKR